jgi:anthranilate synthase/aminodeoxychorismate synthase-like glutamine amidotransferase
VKVLLVDHQDSFTWNLAHAIGAWTGELPRVADSREVEPERVAAAPPDLLVLGPGPGHPANPADAARSLELLAALPPHVPVFGVCFGLQLLVTALGGTVVPAAEPVHGKSRPVLHGGSRLFAGLPSPVSMMRYHSLVAERSSLPRHLRVAGESPEREVMAVEHESRPLFAVQFHPESVGSPLGSTLLRNALALARTA